MLLIVLPVCAKDIASALRNVDALIQWDGRCDFPCLIAHERGFENDIGPLFDLCVRYFTKVDTFCYDVWKGEQQWPYIQNHTFQNTARHIESSARRNGWTSFFWWESDCVPTKAGGFSAIANAHQLGKRSFTGPVASQLGITYLVGVSIYPVNVSQHMSTALRCRATSWDIQSTNDGVLRSAHDISPLIAHNVMERNIHFGSMEDVVQHVPDSAYFFHKCKDNSLLDVIQGKTGVAPSPEINVASTGRHQTPSFTEQTDWASGYFTFPASTNTIYFNCGICEYNDGTFLFTRRERYNLEMMTGGALQGRQSDLAIWKIRPNMTLEPTPILPTIPKRYPDEQWEDPRVVIGDDGQAYVGFATWQNRRPQISIRQSFARMSRDWRHVEPLWESPYGGNTRKPEASRTHEKNWIWFQHAGNWICQYAINPGDLFRVDRQGNPVEVFKSKEVRLTWDYGLPLRGGTPPIQVGDEYLAFFHTATVWQKPKRRYYMGAYTFDAEPPFTLRRMTVHPLLTGSEQDFRALSGPLVIFPNGSLLNDGVWTIVFGVNDEACGWIKIPHDDLEQRLVTVNRKGIIERVAEAFA